MGRETIPSPDDLLLLPEVAEITRRSIDTLRWLRHRGEGPRGLRGGGQATGAVRDVVQGPAEGRAEGPAPQAADDADPVGAKTRNVVRSPRERTIFHSRYDPLRRNGSSDAPRP